MKIRVKYCPECSSSSVKWVNPQMWSLWICYNFGYQGPVVLEDEELADEIRKEYLKGNCEYEGE